MTEINQLKLEVYDLQTKQIKLLEQVEELKQKIKLNVGKIRETKDKEVLKELKAETYDLGISMNEIQKKALSINQKITIRMDRVKEFENENPQDDKSSNRDKDTEKHS